MEQADSQDSQQDAEGTPRHRLASLHGLRRLLREALATVVPALLIALAINLFVGQATRVDGQSMEPNLHSSERLLIEKISYRFHAPRRFDVVVIRMPSQDNELLIKRVVGLPGETVEIRDGQVFINGEQLEEQFLTQGTYPGRNATVTVPPLHVYVLGDNRAHSNDSRTFGPVPIKSIIGRAWVVYWPLKDVGLVH